MLWATDGEPGVEVEGVAWKEPCEWIVDFTSEGAETTRSGGALALVGVVPLVPAAVAEEYEAEMAAEADGEGDMPGVDDTMVCAFWGSLESDFVILRFEDLVGVDSRGGISGRPASRVVASGRLSSGEAEAEEPARSPRGLRISSSRSKMLCSNSATLSFLLSFAGVVCVEFDPPAPAPAAVEATLAPFAAPLEEESTAVDELELIKLDFLRNRLLSDCSCWFSTISSALSLFNCSSSCCRSWCSYRSVSYSLARLSLSRAKAIKGASST